MAESIACLWISVNIYLSTYRNKSYSVNFQVVYLQQYFEEKWIVSARKSSLSLALTTCHILYRKWLQSILLQKMTKRPRDILRNAKLENAFIQLLICLLSNWYFSVMTLEELKNLFAACISFKTMSSRLDGTKYLRKGFIVSKFRKISKNNFRELPWCMPRTWQEHLLQTKRTLYEYTTTWLMFV